MEISTQRKKLLRTLQKKINYRFKSLALLEQGLCHKSYCHEVMRAGLADNERLEFLGDAVLDLVIGHLIMERHPDFAEGELTRLRAAVVNKSRLAKIAREIDLGTYLLLGKGEELTGGRQKNSILASSLEALLAAIYLDGGFKKAFAVISALFSAHLEATAASQDYQDFKTQLQEFAQEIFKDIPRYQLAKEMGPDHDKIFGVKVFIQDRVVGLGAGKSKKEAEQRAAQKCLRKLNPLLPENHE